MDLGEILQKPYIKCIIKTVKVHIWPDQVSSGVGQVNVDIHLPKGQHYAKKRLLFIFHCWVTPFTCDCFFCGISLQGLGQKVL